MNKSMILEDESDDWEDCDDSSDYLPTPPKKSTKKQIKKQKE